MSTEVNLAFVYMTLLMSICFVHPCLSLIVACGIFKPHYVNSSSFLYIACDNVLVIFKYKRNRQSATEPLTREHLCGWPSLCQFISYIPVCLQLFLVVTKDSVVVNYWHFSDNNYLCMNF